MKKVFILVVSFLMVVSLSKMSLAYDVAGIEVHGFVSQGFVWSDENNYPLSDGDEGSFQMFDAAVNFSKSLTNNLRLGVQFYARDFGDIDNNTLNIDWAFADYRWKDWLGIRVGKMKSVWGFYSEIRDLDMLRTFALLPFAYPEPDREIVMGNMGIGIYGNVPVNKLGSFDYQIEAGQQELDEDEGGWTKFMENLTGLEVNDIDTDIAPTLSLTWNTPLEGLRVGGTFKKLRQTLETGVGDISLDMEAYILSAEYTWDNLIVAAEFMNLLPEGADNNIRYYASATYRFSDLFEAGMWYGEVYSEEDDKDGDNYEAMGLPDFAAWQKEFCLALRFDINEYWVVKLEGHMVNGTALVLPSDTPFDEMEEDWSYGIVKTTFSF